MRARKSCRGLSARASSAFWDNRNAAIRRRDRDGVREIAGIAAAEPGTPAPVEAGRRAPKHRLRHLGYGRNRPIRRSTRGDAGGFVGARSPARRSGHGQPARRCLSGAKSGRGPVANCRRGPTRSQAAAGPRRQRGFSARQDREFRHALRGTRCAIGVGRENAEARSAQQNLDSVGRLQPAVFL